MKKESNTKNVVMVTAAILGLIVICIGGTYAYFTAMAQSNVQTITTGTLTATYNTGRDINATNIIPTAEAESTEHHFNITNDGNAASTMDLSFVELSLTKAGTATTSGNLKWALYEASDNTYTVAEGASVVAAGDFSTVASPMTIKNDIAIGANATKYYVLRIWLNEIGAPQNEDQGMAFSAKVQVEMQ